MEKNVGDTDQLVRIALGAVLGIASLGILAQSQGVISEVVAVPGIASPVLGVIALVLLGTAYTRECPVCAAVGIDTTE